MKKIFMVESSRFISAENLEQALTIIHTMMDGFFKVTELGPAELEELKEKGMMK